MPPRAPTWAPPRRPSSARSRTRIAGSAIRTRRGSARSSTAATSVLEVIGRGGMGVVYRVEHLRMGKIAAMKVLHRDLAERCRCRRAVRARGRRDLEAPPPAHRAGLRLRDRRRRAVPDHGVRARRRSRAHDPARRADAVVARGAAARADLRRAAGGARARHRPPRSQAGERADHAHRRRARLREGARLRPREARAARRAERDDRSPADRRHAVLHVARADSRRRGRRAQRYLFVRRADVRAAHRSASVRRLDRGRRAHEAPDGGARRAVDARAADGHRSAGRSSVSQGAREGSRRSAGRPPPSSRRRSRRSTPRRSAPARARSRLVGARSSARARCTSRPRITPRAISACAAPTSTRSSAGCAGSASCRSRSSLRSCSAARRPRVWFVLREPPPLREEARAEQRPQPREQDRGRQPVTGYLGKRLSTEDGDRDVFVVHVARGQPPHRHRARDRPAEPRHQPRRSPTATACTTRSPMKAASAKARSCTAASIDGPLVITVGQTRRERTSSRSRTSATRTR